MAQAMVVAPEREASRSRSPSCEDRREGRAPLTWAVPRAVAVPRPGAFEAKLARLAAAGGQHLQLVVDFDHTLTRFFLPDGRSAPMCHDVVESSPLMPEAFRQGYKQLWADQKAGLFSNAWNWEDWWRRSHGLMTDHGLRRDWLPEMVRSSGIRCRERCGELFELLRRHQIPVLIVSAGITEVIRATMELERIPLGENVRVVANGMLFDEGSGRLRSFSEPLVHSFSKSSVGHHARDYFESIARKHAIVVGDSVTDVDCLENVAGLDGDIRVGLFDAGKRRGQRPRYEETFDVVVSSEGLHSEGGEPCLSHLIELLRACGVGA